jgi:hypothetical protein
VTIFEPLKSPRDNAERIGELIEQLRRLGWEAIPCAKLDALMGAAKVVAAIPLWRASYPDSKLDRVMSVLITPEQVLSARAALRAAGIDPSEGKTSSGTAHAKTSFGPVNCSIRRRFQNEPNPRTCERCGLGPCPFFNNDGTSKLLASIPDSRG